MKARMRMTYDAAADALSIDLVASGRAARTVHVTPDCSVDLDEKGRPVSIEILQARHYYQQAALEQLASTVEQLTLAEASAESGLAVGTLKAQIHNGRLRAAKKGNAWLVSRADLVTYLEDRGPAGRPVEHEDAEELQRAVVRRSRR